MRSLLYNNRMNSIAESFIRLNVVRNFQNYVKQIKGLLVKFVLLK